MKAKNNEETYHGKRGKKKSQKTIKYNQDPVFRKKVLQANTARYRAAHSSGLRNCLSTIKNLSKFGSLRRCIEITKAGEVIEKKLEVTFSAAELAKALGYHTVVMYGWHSSGRFPRPKVHVSGKAGRIQLVYTLEQAKRLVEIMGVHQKDSQYLRNTDTAVIAMFAQAMG